MKFLIKSVVLIVLTSLWTSSLAQQQQSITRELEVGALFTSGNTDEQALPSNNRTLKAHELRS